MADLNDLIARANAAITDAFNAKQQQSALDQAVEDKKAELAQAEASAMANVEHVQNAFNNLKSVYDEVVGAIQGNG